MSRHRTGVSTCAWLKQLLVSSIGNIFVICKLYWPFKVEKMIWCLTQWPCAWCLTAACQCIFCQTFTSSASSQTIGRSVCHSAVKPPWAVCAVRLYLCVWLQAEHGAAVFLNRGWLCSADKTCRLGRRLCTTQPQGACMRGCVSVDKSDKFHWESNCCWTSS